jgi:hypothetical protein
MSDTKGRGGEFVERRAVASQSASERERAQRDLPLARGLKRSSFFLPDPF